MKFIYLIVAGLLIFCASGIAAPKLPDNKCIASIVGEYAVDDEYGMRLIAHAIRNRGHLRGVYGWKAAHNKNESKYIWELASLAWFESAHEKDISKGADSWYSFDDVHSVFNGIIPENTVLIYARNNRVGFVFFKSKPTKNRR